MVAMLVALLTLVALCLAVLMLRGFRATSTPSKLETVVARDLRNLSIPWHERHEKNPFVGYSQALQQGRHDLFQRCAVCDGLTAAAERRSVCMSIQLNSRNFEVVNTIQPRARFGPTATLQMQDREIWLRASSFSGPVIFTYPAERGIREGVLSQVRYIQILFAPAIREADLKRAALAKWPVDEWWQNTVAHPEKNRCLKLLMNGYMSRNRYIVVLADKLKHIAYVNNLLDKHDPNVIKGDMKIEAIDDIINVFEQGLARLIIASRVFNKGVSINRIDTIVSLAEMGDANTIVQQIGRELRLHEDKGEAIFIDFGTTGRGGRAAKARLAAVQAAGLPIEVYEWGRQQQAFWRACKPSKCDSEAS